jgi:hypothetical protein
MAVDVNAELPLLILIAGFACALIAWLLGTFTHFLRGYRYRAALGLIAFPVSGLMGFFSTLKFSVSVFGEWLSARLPSVRHRRLRLYAIRLSRLLDRGARGRQARSETYPLRALQSGRGAQEAGRE